MADYSKSSIERSDKVLRVVIYIVSIFFSILTLFPFFLMFINATRSSAEIQRYAVSFISEHPIQNLQKNWAVYFDLHIFKVNDNYVALFSDQGNRGLCMARSKSLYPARSRFGNVKRLFNSFPDLRAPVTIPSLKNDGWLLMSKIDNYFTYFAAPMAEAFKLQWKFYDQKNSKLPSDMNEGKVVVITRSELSQLLMTLDGVDTGIQQPAKGTTSSSTDDAIYNLSGQQVGYRSNLRSTHLPHGIYITKGKKITIK